MSQPYDTPLWGDPDRPKPQRQLSKKEQDDAANKVTWTRYKVSGVQCSDCVTEYPLGRRTSIGPGAWLRVKGEDKRVLCWYHKAEYLSRGDKPEGE